MEDIELLSKCKDSPDEGLGKVIELYIDLVYSIVFGKISNIGSSEDAKECVSDVFVAFYQQIGTIDLSKGSIKAYLAMIASRKGINLYRKLSRQASKSVHMEEQLYEFEDLKTNLEQEILKKEEKKALLEALEALGEPDKEIFVRKYYMGQKTKEIAQVLGLRDNTVDKKISRGLNKLKVLLGGVNYGEKDYQLND